ncbi:MAG: class I SAM-dependent methyltransferase, partial [Anaerolineae bacterium]|nr:class I SAM-dependent methyltransferase [Anaerolineae bacterium]
MSESKAFYDTVASRHRLFYRDWPAYVKQDGAWLDSLLCPRRARTVLDCTCGIGTQAIALALLGYEVSASDLSAENLAQAQRGADEFGVSIAWHRGDVRALDEVSLAGPFDAVLSLGNSLSHLLTEADMQTALRQMVDQTRPGGLVIVGQRDWDAIAAERPRFRFRHEHVDTPAPGLRTVLWDLWSYDDPLVTFEVFF